MRVVDLDRDMRDVIPTGTTRDSEFLFARMTDRTLALARGAGGRVLDVACGIGQDSHAMALGGAFAVGLEPSGRMSALAQMVASEKPAPRPHWVRGWSDALPFRRGSFDAVFCKGSIDHFDRPRDAIAEMARVVRPGGRVVLAIANFDSLSCRLARAADALTPDRVSEPPRGRRHYDVPHDHFTRYELALMREQAEASLELEVVEGLSLLWGVPAFSRALERVPEAVAGRALQGLDAVARAVPALADVVVLAGRPRAASTSR